MLRAPKSSEIALIIRTLYQAWATPAVLRVHDGYIAGLLQLTCMCFSTPQSLVAAALLLPARIFYIEFALDNGHQ